VAPRWPQRRQGDHPSGSGDALDQGGVVVAPAQILLAIGGVALAFRLHVTAGVIVVCGIYWVTERMGSATEGTGPAVSENLRWAAVASSTRVRAPGP
jgi:hypothetical protein